MGIVIDKILGDALMHSHVKKGADDPASASEFDYFYNTTGNALKIFYDGAWWILHTLGIPDKILMESGDYILMETGDEILLES